MSAQILVIDDDQELCSLLKSYLGKQGLVIHAATDPELGLRLFRKLKPSAVILDVMLPGKDGFEVCREIRKEASTPIIMLTARGDITDRVVGLEIGADDYLPKPFDPRELLARIRTVLRRASRKESPAQRLKSGALLLDLQKRSASLKSKSLALTTTEFEILSLFMKNPGAVLERTSILNSVRAENVEAFDRSVDLAISRLRGKLGDSGKEHRFIKTIWGSGYLFSGKVTRHGA
jgi:DNA-binding response OmpR family regulator